MNLDTITDAGEVERTIQEFFEERASRAESLGGQYARLWRGIEEATRGGKRIRPRMLLMTHEHLGGCDSRSALLAGAAFELLHTALLLHDDVLDGDLVRRGRPNLAGGFTAAALDAGHGARAARSWGAASGVLAGDLLISGAHALVSSIESPARATVHRIIDDALIITAAGEHADVGFALRVMRADGHDILRMMKQKTAAYSFAAPLRAGAVLAGAPEEAVSALGRIGVALGVVYQLRDDVLGVFGDESRTGKSALGDLREGKRTLLVAFAEGSPEWNEVMHLFGRAPLDAADADRMRAALVACGAAERVQELIVRQLDEVRGAIAAAPVPGALREELIRIAVRCAERDA
jgi:geranylgeranyl diphosphate synthase type II